VLKALSKKRVRELGLEHHVFREIKIQSYLVHRHITSLYGVFHDEHKIYLIMECMPDGSMHSNGKKRISESEAAHLIAQACDGLLYIHRESIIHRDIKP
jgi:serine/threonine protein kinase